MVTDSVKRGIARNMLLTGNCDGISCKNCVLVDKCEGTFIGYGVMAVETPEGIAKLQEYLGLNPDGSEKKKYKYGENVFVKNMMGESVHAYFITALPDGMREENDWIVCARDPSNVNTFYFAQLWKGSEEKTKEMTVKEIENILGYSVKIVKEDK